MSIRWMILLGCVAYLLLAPTNAMAADRTGESPVRMVRVTMAERTLHTFLAQLQSFADTNAFAVRISQSSPDARDFLVQLWRQDIKGIGVHASNTGDIDVTYSIAFYRNCNDAVPESAFDKVVVQLREALSETEGVKSIEDE